MTARTSKPLTRTEYLIDRHHVINETGVGWHCVCDEFKKLKECRHTRESEGRRAAQAMIAERVRSINGVIAGFTHQATDEEESPLHLRSKRRRR
jgi:hypothetical protein